MLLLALATVSCGGPGEQEWLAAQNRIAHLEADLDAVKSQHVQDERRIADAECEIDDLRDRLLVAELAPVPVARSTWGGITDDVQQQPTSTWPDTAASAVAVPSGPMLTTAPARPPGGSAAASPGRRRGGRRCR
jgi:hypothetical protein